MPPPRSLVQQYLAGADLPPDEVAAVERDLATPGSPAAEYAAAVAEATRQAFALGAALEDRLTVPSRLPSRLGWLITAGLAAAVLVAFGVGRWTTPSDGPGSSFPVAARAVPRTVLGNPVAFQTVEGAIRLPPNSAFTLEFAAPREGFLTVVLLVEGEAPDVLPYPDQAPVSVQAAGLAGRTSSYPGPLRFGTKPTAVLLLVTPRPAADTVRRLLEAADRVPGGPATVVAHIREGIPPSEQPWLDTGRLELIPARPKE